MVKEGHFKPEVASMAIKTIKKSSKKGKVKQMKENAEWRIVGKGNGRSVKRARKREIKT